MKDTPESTPAQTLDIMHLLKIHASPEEVYRALTTADGIRIWWTRDVAIDSSIGGEAEFGFYEHQFVIKMGIQELEPARRVVWKTRSGAPGWEGSTISFYLRPDGPDTVLSFAHRGFHKADEGFAGANTRWGYYLVSLQEYLTVGNGTPNPEDMDFATPRFGVALGTAS